MRGAKPKDRTGQRVGRLTVINYLYTKNGRAYWNCKCDCGNERILCARDIQQKDTISCGCERKDRATTHGKYYTREHRIWLGMKTRCSNPKSPNYKWYGAKGVKVCDEWNKSFQSFYDWAHKNGYSDELTLDRINPFGNYEPTNCRWVTMAVQRINKRKNFKED